MNTGYSRKDIVKALQFHLREWYFEGNEIRANFHNNIKEYLSYKVKCHPVLNLRNY